MNSFQILDKDRTPISMEQLDREAAEFWNKPLSNEEYVTPFGINKYDVPIGANWFDQIGRSIAQQGHYTSGWSNVIYTMCAEDIGERILGDSYTTPKYVKDNRPIDSDTDLALRSVLLYFKPYIDLIKHWENKGYIPKQIKS